MAEHVTLRVMILTDAIYEYDKRDVLVSIYRVYNNKEMYWRSVYDCLSMDELIDLVDEPTTTYI